MYINGKWMTEPEIEAHIAKLKKHCKEMQAENTDLKQRIAELEDKHWDECRQIAHYDDELRKAKVLLKAAVEDITKVPCNNDAYNPNSCDICVKQNNCNYSDSFEWRYIDYVKKLLGGSENDT